MTFKLSFELSVPDAEVMDEEFEERMNEFGQRCVVKLMEACPPGWSWVKEGLQ